jgi:hypothetical protein
MDLFRSPFAPSYLSRLKRKQATTSVMSLKTMKWMVPAIEVGTLTRVKPPCRMLAFTRRQKAPRSNYPRNPRLEDIARMAVRPHRKVHSLGPCLGPPSCVHRFAVYSVVEEWNARHRYCVGVWSARSGSDRTGLCELRQVAQASSNLYK